MRERGLHVDPTTMYRWVQHYAPELEKRCCPHLKGTNDSWRVDETYVKVKKVWMYLYRAVDSASATRWNFCSVPHVMPKRRNASSQKRWLRLIAPLLGSSRWIKTQPTQRPSTNCKQKEPFQTPVNCDQLSTSTTSSNKITASSNDASNPDWASFLLRPHGTRYKDMRS
jgi:DDE superfamily endonuclease